MKTTAIRYASVTLACMLATPSLAAQVLETVPSDEARELYPEELVEQPGEPGLTEGAIIRKPWRTIDRPDSGTEPAEPRDDVIEVEPVPNRDDVYRRLMERLLRDGAIQSADIPREYRRELREWFGDQGDSEQERFRPRTARDRASGEDGIETIPAESLTCRLRTEQDGRRTRKPEGDDADYLREEYLRLVEQRIQGMPADELRHAVIDMKMKQILADIEDLGRVDPEGLAGVRSYLAAQILMTEDIEKLREVSRMLSSDGDVEQDR